jgi:ABC-type multidrug transport system ATPase subunit
MRRRFSIAQAMIGAPELILLDEPTSGLDPELVVKMRELFLERRGSATLVVSSHVLSELETTCDYAVFMERGRSVRQGSMAEVTGTDSIVRITLSQKPNLDQLGAALPACTLKWQEPQLVVQAPRSQPLEETNAACLRALLEQKVGILQLSAGQSLEATYLQVRDRGHQS